MTKRPDVVYLHRKIYGEDEYGVKRSKEIDREVFAYISSVSANEFFEGGRNGLNPEIRVTIFDGDYHDEETLIWNGVAYRVYRTYRGTDQIDLYAERRKGAE